MDIAATNSSETSNGNASARSALVHDLSFWDRRASSFTAYSAVTGYAERFLRIIAPDPQWTVLDMACGGGTLAVPMAGMVKGITAVDFSATMLALLKMRCWEKGIANVRPILGRWEDDWEELGIGLHDVAIASRSLLADDARASVDKLHSAARKRVYISTMVDSGSFDRPMFEATGRKFNMGPDYIHFYYLLYDMGIHANVAFIPEYHANAWGSHEEALEDQRWMFHNLASEEEERVKIYLREHLSFVNGRWRLSYERLCLWAVIWWEKQGAGQDAKDADKPDNAGRLKGGEFKCKETWGKPA
jgi:SAM-dependent methyltransferase